MPLPDLLLLLVLLGGSGVIFALAARLVQLSRRLRAEHAHRQTLFDHKGSGHLIVSATRQILEVNRQFCDLFGYTPEELIGQSALILHLDQAHYDAWAPLFQQTRDGMAQAQKEYPWRRKDGSIFWCIFSGVKLVLPSGALGVIWSVIDITARKHAEEEKNTAIARFQTLVDSLDALVYVADMTTHELLFVNRYGREVWGDIVGQKCWQALQAGQAGPCSFCTNPKLLNGAGQPTGTYVWEFQNTVTQEWYECRDQAIPWTDGHFVRMEIATAITERKQAAMALAAEKERLAVTLRCIGDGVITTDTEGRIILINQVAEHLTGWSQAEANGKRLSEVFHICHEHTRQVCDNPVEKVLAFGQIIGLANHTVLIARDGRERSIADSGAPIRDTDNRIIGVVLVFRDITETQRLEAELQKGKKLESVGVLAGGIAHDFNNILVAILGNLNLARQLVAEEGEAYPLLLAAEKASLRARDLTQQLLTFSKGGEPVKKTASIPEIIRDSAEFVLHGGKVSAQYHIPEDLWLVEIDTGQMSQVIQNLIINAQQAMPAGGSIDISCENFAATSVPGLLPLPLPANQYVKITIHDSGIGIPAEIVDKIFDPYFSTKQQGSGLGLAVTHSIIMKHHGRITVTSKPDDGTTFTIYLPASFNQLQSAPIDTKCSAPDHLAILVMDDDAMVTAISKTILQRLGHEVVLAHDGHEAIALFQQRRHSVVPFDLVIMDLTIPGGMGGKEAVQQILAIDPTATVIVSSGYSNDPIMADYQAYGFKGAVAKPYTLQELSDMISRLTFGHPAKVSTE